MTYQCASSLKVFHKRKQDNLSSNKSPSNLNKEPTLLASNTAAMTDQSESPLLCLPGELRELIYKKVVEDTELWVDEPKPTPSCTGILLACKQTHHEAIGMYYKHTIFCLMYRSASRKSRLSEPDWFKSIPKWGLDLIEEVRWDFGPGPMWHYWEAHGLMFSRIRVKGPTVSLAAALGKGVIRIRVLQRNEEVA